MIVITAKITLANGEEINIDQNNILSIDGSISARGDTKLPSYGIISNSGNLSFRDTNFKVLEYSQQQRLVEGLKTEIFVKNTLNQKTEKIGEYETKTWDYNNENFIVNVFFGDNITNWQNIQIEGINYNVRLVRHPFENMAELYVWLREKTQNFNYNVIAYEDLDNQTKNILENTVINYPLLNEDNLWRQWTKICEVCGLYMYNGENGIIQCKYFLGA